MMPVRDRSHAGQGNFLRQHIRLSLFFFFLLFLSGRIGLFLHEFMGHALFWRMLGGGLGGFRLFVFGGGWVCFAPLPAGTNPSFFSRLLVELGGIAVELLVGVLLILMLRFVTANRSVRGLMAATSAVLIVHSLFYLFTGTYYGAGDGHTLFYVLPEGVRQVFLSLIFALTAGGAFFVSHGFSPLLRSWTGDLFPRKRTLLIFSCALVAALMHGTLTFGERVLLRDSGYEGLKTPTNVHLMGKELSEIIAKYKAKYGREPDEAYIAAVKKKLREKYWQFPMKIPLVIAIVAAFIAGYFLSGRRYFNNKASPVVWKEIIPLGCFSAFAIVLILLMNRL